MELIEERPAVETKILSQVMTSAALNMISSLLQLLLSPYILLNSGTMYDSFIVKSTRDPMKQRVVNGDTIERYMRILIDSFCCSYCSSKGFYGVQLARLACFHHRLLRKSIKKRSFDQPLDIGNRSDSIIYSNEKSISVFDTLHWSLLFLSTIFSGHILF